MKQCRTDCIHIEACRRFADNNTYWNIGDCPIYKPTADVAPKSEVAREIFAEIYEDCFDQFGYIDYEKLAELKEKYTKGGVEE